MKMTWDIIEKQIPARKRKFHKIFLTLPDIDSFRDALVLAGDYNCLMNYNRYVKPVLVHVAKKLQIDLYDLQDGDPIYFITRLEKVIKERKINGVNFDECVQESVNELKIPFDPSYIIGAFREILWTQKTYTRYQKFLQSAQRIYGADVNLQSDIDSFLPKLTNYALRYSREFIRNKMDPLGLKVRLFQDAFMSVLYEKSTYELL